jgi:GPH family glycoside/pentoside/hexuronide:cation symporter
LAASARPLPWSVILANAGPSFVLTLVAFNFYVNLPMFYADTIGIPLTLLGPIILLSRVWDALLDPTIGGLSDATRGRWGRRLPWVAAGLVPLVVTNALLMTPWLFGTGGLQVAVLGAVTLLFFLFWTMIAVPYEALGAELTFDYDERSRLFGVREGSVVLGTLVAALLPILLASGLKLDDSREGIIGQFNAVAATHAVLLLLLGAAFLLVVRERKLASTQVPASFKLDRRLLEPLRHRPFRLLLAAYTIAGIGAALPPTLFLFFADRVLESPNAGPLLVLYLLLGVLFLPLWIWLPRKMEKKSAWLLAIALNTGAFCWTLALGAGDEKWFALIIVLSAIGYGGTLVIPPSMQADVIDLDEHETGTRREGQFIGLWSISKKLAAAVGAGVALPALGLFGYTADGPLPQRAIIALTVLYAGVPCLCNLVAFLIARRYPLTRAEHHRLREEIDRRGVARS